MKKITPITSSNLSAYAKKEWKILLLVTVSGLLFDGLMWSGSVLMGNLVDAVASRQTQAVIIKAAAVYISVILFLQLMRIIKRYSVRIFANRMSATMRLMIYNSILHASPSEIQKKKTGDWMSRAVSDVDIAVEGVRKVITEVFDTGVLMTGYFVTMLIYDPKVAILSCLGIPVAMFAAQRMKKTVSDQNRKARRQASRVTDDTYEQASHMLLYRINGISTTQNSSYSEQLQILEKEQARSDMLDTSLQPVYNAIAMLGAVAVFVLGASNVYTSVWTIGRFSAFLSMFIAFATKASKAAKLFNTYQKANVSWKRIEGTMQEYLPFENACACCHSAESLTVRDLSFTYPETSQKQIDGFNLQAHAGEIIGVTGPVACGKSTLAAALLCSEGSNGTILIDEEPAQPCAICYMGHDSMLLNDTIENNIRLSDTGDVNEAIDDVDFRQDLLNMDKGLQTEAGSAGIRLSGGQQQRVALARTLYHKTGVMILDDPFASLDKKTEKNIYENLRRHYSDQIIILISHRLNIFPKLDKVILMKDGSTFITGTHEQLMKDPQYSRLFKLQEEGSNE